jgi:Short C-terminal domain/Phospholipase_D-nuclease N-terminal
LSQTEEECQMVLAAYPFLEVFWTMLIFFAFVVWLWILFTVIADLFRRDDISGWAKAAWIAFVVVLPYLGVFVYLIAEHQGMTERTLGRQREAEDETARYVRSVARGSDPVQQINEAKTLLDKGAITPAEYERIKATALGSSEVKVGGDSGA